MSHTCARSRQSSSKEEARDGGGGALLALEGQGSINVEDTSDNKNERAPGPLGRGQGSPHVVETCTKVARSCWRGWERRKAKTMCARVRAERGLYVLRQTQHTRCEGERRRRLSSPSSLKHAVNAEGGSKGRKEGLGLAPLVVVHALVGKEEEGEANVKEEKKGEAKSSCPSASQAAASASRLPKHSMEQPPPHHPTPKPSPTHPTHYHTATAAGSCCHVGRLEDERRDGPGPP